MLPTAPPVPGSIDLGCLADLVLEVGVDDALLRPLDQRHEQAQPLADLFEHRVADVDPPLVGLDVLDQRELCCDRRDRLLVLQGAGDLP